MVTTAFSVGKVKSCSTESIALGYIGDQDDQLKMYNLGFALLVIAIVFIPIYLFVVPCCFRNPEAPYDLN